MDGDGIMGITNYYSSLIFSYSTLEWSSLVSHSLFQPPCFLFFKMVLNLNVSIHLNILVLLSPLIYHGLLTSNLSALKLVKLLGSSTITSISMLLLKLFSLCITLLSFPILPIAPLSGTHPFFSPTNSEILSKTQHLALKMWSHKWDSDYSSLNF